MSMADDVLDDLRKRIAKTLDDLRRELAKVRTGRANPALLEGVRVDYYGTMSPLQNVANVTVADPRLIVIKPWEKSMIPVIEKAINAERVAYAGEPRYIAGLLQVLGQFGHKDEAIDVMLHYARPDATGYNADVFFRPAMREIWRDPRSIAAAAHMGLLTYWSKSGHWPDFCGDPTLPYDCKKEAAKYHV